MNSFFESIVGAAENHEFQHVFVNQERLSCLALEWAKKDFEVPNWRTPVHWPFDNDDFIQFLGISTAINFCYRAPGSKERFSTIWHGQKWFGAFAMSACVMRAIEEGHDLLNAENLALIPWDEMKEIFRGNTEIPLLAERWRIWCEVGRLLYTKYYGGRFVSLFEAANYRCFDNGNGICERLVKDFPLAFKDIRELNGQTLPFHKKALLLLLLYYGRARASDGKLKQIEDAESISPVADYELPHAFHGLSVFNYAPEMEKKIERLEEIKKGSPEEIEDRVLTVLATRRMLLEVNYERRKWDREPVVMPHLDYFLWKAGRDSITPHRITLCTDY